MLLGRGARAAQAERIEFDASLQRAILQLWQFQPKVATLVAVLANWGQVAIREAVASRMAQVANREED